MELTSSIKMVFELHPYFDRDLGSEAEGSRALEKDSPQQGGKFIPHLVDFFREEESVVKGPVMEQRAAQFKDLTGHRHLEAMLRHQEKIPREWHGLCLIGPETIWVDPDGRRRVMCLCFNGNEWFLTSRMLDLIFSAERCRFIHFVKLYAI